MIAEPTLDAPDEEWLVWADAMQQIGDPRGELLALAPHPARFDAFVRDNAEALLGRELGRCVRKDEVRVTRWRRCVPDELELRIFDVNDGPPRVKAAFTAPSAAHLRSLVVAGVPQHDRVVDLAWTIEWISRRDLVPLPPALRAIALVDDRARDVDHLLSREQGNPDPNLVTFGVLVALWGIDQVEHVKLVVADPEQVQFGRIRMPGLKSFTLHALRYVPELGTLLASAQWPKLASFELRLVPTFMQNDPTDAKAYAPIYGNTQEREELAPYLASSDVARWREELEPLFTALSRLPLKRLALTSFEHAKAVLDLIEQHAFPSLVELDLSDSAFDAGEAARLANNPLMLQLERLVLERVQLPSATSLRGIGPEVMHSHTPHTPTYRYIVTWE